IPVLLRADGEGITEATPLHLTRYCDDDTLAFACAVGTGFSQVAEVLGGLPIGLGWIAVVLVDRIGPPQFFIGAFRELGFRSVAVLLDEGELADDPALSLFQ